MTNRTKYHCEELPDGTIVCTPAKETTSSGSVRQLVQRLFVARSHMAQHQKERDNGKLILECCELMGGAVLSIAHLEACLEEGAILKKQDGEWWIFAKDGNGIKGRAKLEDLLLDLPPMNATTMAPPEPQND